MQSINEFLDAEIAASKPLLPLFVGVPPLPPSGNCTYRTSGRNANANLARIQPPVAPPPPPAPAPFTALVVPPPPPAPPPNKRTSINCALGAHDLCHGVHPFVSECKPHHSKIKEFRFVKWFIPDIRTPPTTCTPDRHCRHDQRSAQCHHHHHPLRDQERLRLDRLLLPQCCSNRHQRLLEKAKDHSANREPISRPVRRCYQPHRRLLWGL